ncbi:MAG: ATP synthase F1 subunit delta [Candidatus Magasanikbacteria bacterium]|nr:ATP synthase F1 subunit delta [Candidatus Magasanikbacteria bacterium]
MAKNTPKIYARALLKTISGLSEKDLSKTLKNFVALVAGEHKLKQMPKIIEEFIRLSKKEEGIQEIEITTARELDEKTIEKIKHIFGKDTEATTAIDESLLGGVKIKTGDKILDGSLKTQLNKLKQTLI